MRERDRFTAFREAETHCAQTRSRWQGTAKATDELDSKRQGYVSERRGVEGLRLDEGSIGRALNPVRRCPQQREAVPSRLPPTAAERSRTTIVAGGRT